jgi:hypothetical protein
METNSCEFAFRTLYSPNQICRSYPSDQLKALRPSKGTFRRDNSQRKSDKS